MPAFLPSRAPRLRPRDYRDANADPQPTLWERVVEPYAAGLVLEDLVGRSGDAGACLRVLARFAVTRTVLLVRAGELNGPALRVEIGIAANHLRRLPSSDTERDALRRLLRAGTTPRISLRFARHATRAGVHAAAAGHAAGAYRLFHLAYMVALAGGWPRDAAAAARSIARDADRAGASGAARLWRARAERLSDPHIA